MVYLFNSNALDGRDIYELSDARNTKNIHQPNLNQQRHTGTPEAKWKYDVENDIRQMGIVNWSQVAQDSDGWRGATGEALR